MPPVRVVLEAHGGVFDPLLLRQGVAIDERVVLRVDDYERHSNPRKVVGRVHVVVELLIDRSVARNERTTAVSGIQFHPRQGRGVEGIEQTTVSAWVAKVCDVLLFYQVLTGYGDAPSPA